MKVTADIDIDCANRTEILKFFKNVSAKQKNGKPHNSGVYFHDVPYDPLTDLCLLEYNEAEEKGYFKIDLLNVHLYKDIKDREHLNKLLNEEPDWNLLQHKEIVDMLFHLNGHFDIVNEMNPMSIDQLAMVLAIIRPAKRNLLGQPWPTIEKQVWLKPSDDSYYFKKSHAIGYAHVIVLQLNLLRENPQKFLAQS
jgi:hypothetical protein